LLHFASNNEMNISTFSKADFKATHLGREIAQYGLLFNPERNVFGHNILYDVRLTKNPCLFHIVTPQYDDSDFITNKSAYSIHGKCQGKKSTIEVIIGHGFMDMASSIHPVGFTGGDEGQINLKFTIKGNTVTWAGLNWFGCNEILDARSIDNIWNDVNNLIYLLNDGHFLNFREMKKHAHEQYKGGLTGVSKKLFALEKQYLPEKTLISDGRISRVEFSPQRYRTAKPLELAMP